jgi:hypothetical protein
MMPLKSNQERMPEERITIYNCKGRSISELTPEDVRRAVENYKPGAEELILRLYHLLRVAENARRNVKELRAFRSNFFNNVEERRYISMYPWIEEGKGEVALYLHKTNYYFSERSPIKWETYSALLRFERKKLENNIVEFHPDMISVTRGNNKDCRHERIQPEEIPVVKNLIEELLSEPYQLIEIVFGE